jgi:pilus assembly protein CpaE
LLNALQGKYIAKEKIKLVLNRVARQNRLQVADIEQTLGYPVEAQIPNDGILVPNSVNQGVPFVLTQPTSPISQSIRQLARSVAGVSGGEAMGSTAAFGGPAKRAGIFGG